MNDPQIGHACGVFGVYAPGQGVAHLTYLGLYALQHRGQESAGIAVSDGQTITVSKDMGLVTQVFDERGLNHHPRWRMGVLRPESETLLKEFFASHRARGQD